MAPKYKLTYFNIRGRAEVARIIMAYGDIKYEDIRVDKEKWVEMKPKMPFDQIPVLEVDGEVICQSGAIMRLLAKRTGLMGKTDMDEAKINMIIGCTEDYLGPLNEILHEQDEDRKKLLKAKFQEELPAQTAKVEALLTGDYFVKNKLSLADINLTYGLDFVKALGFTINYDKFPKLNALTKRVNSQPRIAAWIAKRPVTPM